MMLKTLFDTNCALCSHFADAVSPPPSLPLSRLVVPQPCHHNTTKRACRYPVKAGDWTPWRKGGKKDQYGLLSTMRNKRIRDKTKDPWSRSTPKTRALLITISCAAREKGSITTKTEGGLGSDQEVFQKLLKRPIRPCSVPVRRAPLQNETRVLGEKEGVESL
ncbi:hypothetical protein BGZ63DRAFT_370746 [Mariannaea sp. PMI_226]|nr:hypothetical protein BGZ63DRAFT_370746 [Mariannaea sp. PMI_226]